MNDTTFKSTLLNDPCIKIGWKRQKYTRHCYGILSFLIFELKIEFFQKAVDRFLKILDLNSPNTREKYLLKTKCLNFFSLQATAVDRCVLLSQKCFLPISPIYL